MKEKKKVSFAEELPLKKNQIPICYFCEKQVTENDYCYGCKHFICEECDEESVLGEHDVEEHQQKKEEEVKS